MPYQTERFPAAWLPAERSQTFDRREPQTTVSGSDVLAVIERETPNGRAPTAPRKNSVSPWFISDGISIPENVAYVSANQCGGSLEVMTCERVEVYSGIAEGLPCFKGNPPRRAAGGAERTQSPEDEIPARVKRGQRPRTVGYAGGPDDGAVMERETPNGRKPTAPKEEPVCGWELSDQKGSVSNGP